MRKIEVEVQIEAPAERVWEVLNNGDAYRNWNPFIISMVGGERKVGAPFRTLVRIPDKRDIVFTAYLTGIREGEDLMFHTDYLRGLLSWDHYLQVERVSENVTRLYQFISMRGTVLPFIGSMVRKNKEGMELMNEATRKRCAP